MSRSAHARVIGLISDTHGLVRPEVFTAFDGVDSIFHAGDVGGSEVLAVLARIAPVQAVLGNTDVRDDPRLAVHFTEPVGGLTVHVSHGHDVAALSPTRLIQLYDADVIVFGHTHRPQIARLGRRLVVNPGSAGPRRFALMPSVARLTISSGVASVEIVSLTE